MGITNKECLNRIATLVEELNISDSVISTAISKNEYSEALKDATFNEIGDEIWDYYCFVCDVKAALMEVGKWGWRLKKSNKSYIKPI